MAESFTDPEGKPRYGVRLSDLPEDERPDMSVFAAEQAKQRAKEEQAVAQRRGERLRPSHRPSSTRGRGDDAFHPRHGAPTPSWREDDADVDPYASRPDRSSQSSGKPVGEDRLPGRSSLARPGFASSPTAGGGRSASSRGSLRLLISGLVMVFVLPVLIFFASVSYMMGGPGTFSQSSVVESSGDVYLAADTDYMVYASSFGTSTGACTVKDPHGAPISVGKQTSLEMASFRSTEEGLYTVTCPSKATTQYMVGPVLDESRVPIGAFGVVASTVIGLIGVGLLIASFIHRKKR